MAAFPRPLKVGKIDNFTLSLSSGYLDGEVITSATVTTTSAALTINSVSNNGVVISALCTGVTEGDAELHFTWTTATRSGCETHIVIILDC
jgi:uncharacterized protein YjdB